MWGQNLGKVIIRNRWVIYHSRRFYAQEGQVRSEKFKSIFTGLGQTLRDVISSPLFLIWKWTEWIMGIRVGKNLLKLIRNLDLARFWDLRGTLTVLWRRNLDMSCWDYGDSSGWQICSLTPSQSLKCAKRFPKSMNQLYPLWLPVPWCGHLHTLTAGRSALTGLCATAQCHLCLWQRGRPVEPQAVPSAYKALLMSFLFKKSFIFNQ